MLTLLPICDAEIWFDPSFLSRDRSDALFHALRAEIDWETHRIRLFGREVDSPRLSCWIGDQGAHYTYSNTGFEPRPWTPDLLGLRECVSCAAGVLFNGVLANRYRTGRDSMGWHSDDEPELGRQPVIASVSLGATRRFVLKHRRDQNSKHALDLPPGSLLLMRGDTQSNYRHALPKTARPIGERINLTFRVVR